ncbi:hypothetical protein [Bartonella queenslandensis]|uniref:hypothetical protein n=1 Tax=Bartonella queenslandensis TaxID=481138 RepID=UPI0012EA2592|nr:hypothetical protein [Bartonella queenslandensis]
MIFFIGCTGAVSLRKTERHWGTNLRAFSKRNIETPDFTLATMPVNGMMVNSLGSV